MAGAVEMPVKALPHLVLGKQVQNLLAGVALIPGRIMQKYNLTILTYINTQSLEIINTKTKINIIITLIKNICSI